MVVLGCNYIMYIVYNNYCRKLRDQFVKTYVASGSHDIINLGLIFSILNFLIKIEPSIFNSLKTAWYYQGEAT
jgi:hypothetical protein